MKWKVFGNFELKLIWKYLDDNVEKFVSYIEFFRLKK